MLQYLVTLASKVPMVWSSHVHRRRTPPIRRSASVRCRWSDCFRCLPQPTRQYVLSWLNAFCLTVAAFWSYIPWEV